MSHPPILIVDEQDRPIGKASFKEADKKDFIRRVVRLMLKNKNGQILLQKRSDNVVVYPGRWDNSVAGHVDYGETTEQALMREAYEELGIEDFNPEKVGTYYNEVPRQNGSVRKFNHLYEASYTNTPENYSREEVSEVRWFDINKLKETIKADPSQFTDGVIEVVKRFY